MSMTETRPNNLPPAPRKDGLIGLWGRIVHRDRQDYETWLEERDMTIITAALLRLNERQLNRLGMSRATLALDVEDLAFRAKQEAEVTLDILRLVDDAPEDRQDPHAPPRAIAAE